MQKLTGYVTKWDPRGFGFIHRDDLGGEIFFHASELTGRTELRAGENVEFAVASAERITIKRRAVKVVVLAKAPE